MRIEKLMSRDVQCCSPDSSLADAAKLMWDYDCGSVPVCTSDGDRQVVGIVTDRDISMCAMFQGKPLGELRVADAMSRGVTTCEVGDESAKVEQTMRERQIRRVPITESSGKLVGIVSLADLAREAGPGSASSSSAITESEVGDTLAAICEPPSNRGSASQSANA